MRAPFKNISNIVNDEETYYNDDGDSCGNKCAKIVEPIKKYNNFVSHEEKYHNDRTLSKTVGPGKSNGENREMGIQDSEKGTKKVVKIFRHLGCSVIKGIMSQENRCVYLMIIER